MSHRTCLIVLSVIAVVPAARAADPVPLTVAPAVVCECPVDLSGRWHGCWISDKAGHTGPLNASIRKISDCKYRVRFTGRFWTVVPFVYGVTMTVTGQQGGVVTLSGETVAGPVIGTFTYDATATKCHFEAHFCSSKGDYGRFILSR